MTRFVVVVLAVLIGTVASKSLDWRIVGGETAEEGQFPYQISLRNGGSHSCGGSIISDRFILCAAHCLDGASPSRLTVVAGTNKRSSGGVKYEVESIAVHEKWDPYDIINDVGILKLKESIEFSEKIQPIELNKEEIGGGADLVLSGWGRTAYPGSAPEDLQFIKLKSITVEECKARQSPLEVIASEICTFTQKGQGACHGDSGGPLAYNGKVAGIVSWGRPCAIGYPDVFTRVSSFADWIENKMATM